MTTTARRSARRLGAASFVVAAAVGAVAVSSSMATAASSNSLESRTGIVVEAHGDDLEHGEEHAGFGLRLASGEHLELQGLGSKAHSLVGKKVTVKGTSHGHEFDVDSAAVVADGGGTAAAVTADAAVTPVSKRVAVLLVNFTVPAGSVPATPWTASQVDSVVFSGSSSVAAYYSDLSNGAWTLTGQIFGYYTVPSSTTCDYSAFGTAAKNQAIAAGVDLSQFTNIVYVWPSHSACGWSGMGQLPGTTSWINGSVTTRTIGHELGHNFGEHHASTLRCTDSSGAPVEWSSSCTSNEYGDPFSIMGGTTNLEHASALAHYGLVAPVDAPSSGGSWTIAPADSDTGTRIVRIARGDGTYLSLDFRQPHGVFDTWAATAPVANGVGIRIDYGNGYTQTKLIDTTPSTTTFSDAPLLSGRAWTDPVSTATITVGAVSSAGAEVTVSYGSDVVAPSGVSGLKATAASNGSSVSLTWTAATDNRGVASYNVVADGVVIGTATGTSASVATNPGTSYVLGVQAVDSAGNVGPLATVPVSTPTVDTVAPTAVPSLKGSASKNRTVKLSWTAATDNVGVVGYVVSRAGASDRTVTTLSFSERLASGSYTWSVRAKDAAGNLSAPASVSVSVR